MARLLEGKPCAQRILETLKDDTSRLSRRPVLASIRVGECAAACSYVQAQKKAAGQAGIMYREYALETDSSERDVLRCIEGCNNDAAIDGIMLHMPLPAPLDGKRIRQNITPAKDVEGIHACNLGGLMCGERRFIPCTAEAVMELIASSGVDLYGREAVVVGSSDIVGKPVALLLLEKSATVTVCHIATSQAGRLKEHVSGADILVVAAGKPGLIRGDWIKAGAVVIDVGINRTAGKITGDVEFTAAAQRAAWITPVPGGVGPLTAMILMRNVVAAAKMRDTKI